MTSVGSYAKTRNVIQSLDFLLSKLCETSRACHREANALKNKTACKKKGRDTGVSRDKLSTLFVSNGWTIFRGFPEIYAEVGVNKRLGGRIGLA